MRQLAQTGWMHNRARMVVGSFLTKDLHIDWREGERHFARLLLDGEPAQNNGNWQWIASVGADPARTSGACSTRRSSSASSTPTAATSVTWVPELAGVPDAKLAEPWTMTAEEQAAAGCVIGTDYPAPIVDHAHEREVAKQRATPRPPERRGTIQPRYARFSRPSTRRIVRCAREHPAPWTSWPPTNGASVAPGCRS